jgi:SAM-dependent methyltransferase
MGISVNALRFLFHCRETGVDFSKSAMIGRQKLNVSLKQFNEIANDAYRYKIPLKELKNILDGRYIDPLLRLLGATEVHSFDVSDYQQATHIHDFNKQLSPDHRNQYTAVLEGGTLEHVFNFPRAMENCMQMLSPGGHFLAVTPTNNYMGHGFYQFSPELFFNVFSESNGFRLEEMFLYEGNDPTTWYRVANPANVHSRVTLRNALPASLLVLALKTADKELFSTSPFQSDYVELWGAKKMGSRRVPVMHYARIRVQGLVGKILARFIGPSRKKRYYQPIASKSLTCRKHGTGRNDHAGHHVPW